MKGWSQRNLLFRREFATAYEQPEIVKQVVSQLPWGSNILHKRDWMNVPESTLSTREYP